MLGRLEDKTDPLVEAVTADPRWVLEDELMVQVLGFTLYGYAFALGRIICLMDVEDINASVAGQLAALGVGPKYAQGLAEAAFEHFINEEDQSVHSQLVNIGHSHIASEDLSECVESIFQNTETLREHMQ
ncbi:hypothetical protein Pan153_09620 [Gimesia panareensis]|uniref:Uncharacterized protein n=1 Tax=Gimesia panareensis TaxID=2527978 RepID=A0A518FJ05_9PLAN|nr:hypothetical protein [Gimesia panareensis]QDV16335.1 hypothetical protein Pan153_09620 [Gimesia panareensis]